jgi:Na+-transporting methylmalonyl-CoA/oxaloacetate decarboxylase gamma subunit
MIDGGLVAEIAGGGYGLGILVLVVLSLVIWIIGLVVQKTAKTATENKEVPTKEK